MLKIDKDSGKLLRVPRLGLRSQPLARDYDLAGMITGSPAEFFSEIDENLFVIGANLGPHGEGPSPGGVDLLALDLNGNAVAVIVEAKQKPSSFSRALLCSEWLANWEPPAFTENLSEESRERLEKFLVAGLEQINRGRRLILIAENHSTEIAWAARNLRERCGIDINVLRAAVAADAHSGERYLWFRREFPAAASAWATLVRPRGTGEALHFAPEENSSGSVSSTPAAGEEDSTPTAADLRSPLAVSGKEDALRTLAGAFADHLSHAMAAVDGSADLAFQEAPRDSGVRQRFEEIRRVAERAAKLTDELRTYAGHGTRNLQRLELAGLVERVVESSNGPRLPNVTLLTDFAADLPEFAADATLIGRVVSNLLDNAVEALPDHGGTISVRTGRATVDRGYLAGCLSGDGLAEGGYLYIEVADSGFGMDDHLRARIFDPFFTTKAPDRGLGLSAVLGIVRNHGGAVRVESEPGAGSTFRVLLPLPAERVVGTVRDTGKPASVGTGRTVLVVDAQESMRTLARQTFEADGFSVLTADDGWDALEVFAKSAETIDVVLLDWMLPNLDAEEAFRAMRRIRQETRIILCGPFPEEEASRRFNGKKLAAYIRKPFHPEGLAACTRQVLEVNPASSGAKAS